MTEKCPIVGIGASAGGLGALKSFFDNASNDMGAAFVVIQHLDPSHPSFTADILGRHTKMPTRQVKHGATVEINHVYVIPPNATLTLKGNKFELAEAETRHGIRMPIDQFFSSLAKQIEQRAIGIILSGTGSDGTAGLREIKGSGGVIFAQSPETAQFDGMPRAVIATGLVDVVCPVEDMPSQIRDYLSHKYVKQAANSDEVSIPPDDEAHLKSIIALLQARLGQDFRGYKKGTLGRRIIRRMGLRNIQEMSDYLTFLRMDDKEAEELYRDLLINVTSFFRDPEAFDVLEASVLAKLVEAKDRDDQIRVWVPGCATGEEAYSIAMLIIEQCEAAHKDCAIQIFATDIDDQALAVGRAGIYPANLVTDITPERLRRFFIRQDGAYQVTKKMRETVTFASQNLIMDPPFSRLDLISCRNLLIYLEAHLQDKIIGNFNFALNEGGYLFLGRSESTNQLARLFEPVDKKSRIFRNTAIAHASPDSFQINGVSPRRMPNGMFPAPRRKETVRLRELMQQQLLRNYAPAAVLANAKNQALYFMGPTGDYLEQPSGQPTLDLLSMVHADLRKDVRAGLKKVIDSNQTIVTEIHPVQRAGMAENIRLTIKPLTVPVDNESLFLVTFENIAATMSEATITAKHLPQDESTVDQLESKLRDAQEDLQISMEELESSNEELQASHEEMMSVNEELQSANEELETSKEELQAMNEELSTVNYQLKDKVEELANVNDDLKNFVASTGIATLMLDSKHQIGRFTPATKRLFNLIDADIGRPLDDIREKFQDQNFLQDVDRVFHEFQPIEREIMADDGTSYLMRIAPYRAIEQRHGAVILTFVDISQRLKNERALRESEERFRQLVESGPDPLVLINAEGEITLVNSQAQEFFGYDRQEFLSMNIENLLPKRFRKRHHAHRQEFLKDAKVRLMGSGLELLALLKDGEEVPIEVGLSPVRTKDGLMICAAIRDIREHQRAVLAMKQAQSEAEAALAAKSRFLATASHDLRQPLQSLGMLTEALMLKIHDAEIIELVSQQSVSLANMRNLLNSLLDISKLDSGGVEVEIDDVDLQAIITGVCSSFQAEADKKGLELSVDLSDRIVRSDANLLGQILRNLIGNAIRYTTQGRLSVVSRVVGDKMKIAIEDTGVGIPADQLPHIFEEFYQVGRDPQRGDAGLGLGLAIANRIAEKLGCRIDVESTVDAGSVFSFSLPLSDVLLPNKETPVRDAPAADFGNSVVLLVDDDVAVLKSTKFRLSLHPGLRIITAESPRAVTEILDEMAPDLPDIIVTDFHLGAIKNGLDVIEEARAKSDQIIPAILISGDTSLDKNPLEDHDIHVIFKPTDGNELIDTMKQLLSSRKP